MVGKIRFKKNCAKLISLAIIVILAVFSLYSVHKLGFAQKIAIRLGWIEHGTNEPINYAVLGWENCLIKLDYKADIVFFGDSITRGSDFRKDFPGKKICNLGFAGDTLLGMKRRVSMIAAVNPEQVFVLGGVNSIRDTNIEMVYKTYSELLDKIKETVPNAHIYVQSILPVANYKENAWQPNGVCKNSTIRTFNERLKVLAEKKGMTYIDLYSAYELNGSLNPTYTKDGVHIYGHYEPWAKVLKGFIH